MRDRRYDLQFLTPEEYQKLNIFFANLIQVLGEQLKLRQQVIATATVYFKRFYVRNSFRSIDPLLMVRHYLLFIVHHFFFTIYLSTLFTQGTNMYISGIES